jgi:hypothetical protein
MSTHPAERGVRAFLIYGLIGGPFPYGLGYSLGLDVLRDKLRAMGIEASTHVEGVLIPHTNVPESRQPGDRSGAGGAADHAARPFHGRRRRGEDRRPA